MRPQARVIVIGEGVPLEPGMERVSVVAAVDATLPEPALIILGDEALLRLEPTWLKTVRSHAVEVLVATRECRGSCIAAWVRAGARDVIDVETLPAEVASRLERGVGARRRLPVADWCKCLVAAGSPMDAALGLVADLPNAHDVAAWAGAAGHSRQLLWSLSRDELHASPGAVLLWHVAAQVKQAQARGFTIAVIAAALGYSSPSSLSHALAHGCA